MLLSDAKAGEDGRKCRKWKQSAENPIEPISVLGPEVHITFVNHADLTEY